MMSAALQFDDIGAVPSNYMRRTACLRSDSPVPNTESYSASPITQEIHTMAPGVYSVLDILAATRLQSKLFKSVGHAL